MIDCLFDFDRSHPLAIKFAESHAAELITELDATQEDAIRSIIVDGLQRGTTPKNLARRIKSIIGLRQDQVQSIINLANELSEAPPGTLIVRFPPRTGLRSQPGFRVRIPPGGASESFISRQVERYARMQLNARAKLIARTELNLARNEGLRQLWVQAQEIGDIPMDAERVWITQRDERVRPTHVDMEGARTSVTEPFFTPDDEPIEPGLEPNCRCSQILSY